LYATEFCMYTNCIDTLYVFAHIHVCIYMYDTMEGATLLRYVRIYLCMYCMCIYIKQTAFMLGQGAKTKIA
jgi:hypothetical protein